MSDNEKNFDSDKQIDIDRLCRLCRLSLLADEREQSAAELKKMADYTYPRLRGEGDALPFSYCAATSELREDVPADSELSEFILALAPSSNDGYVSVPKVIKEDCDE